MHTVPINLSRVPALTHHQGVSEGTNQDQGKCRILLVDDRPDKALALQSVVEELGHELVIATSGAAGLRELLASKFSLLLLDVEMPEMDGLEMARLIRERRRNAELPIIFVSAIEHSDERLERAYELGAVDFIQLPARRSALRAKITSVLQIRRQAERLATIAAKKEERPLATEERFRLLLENASDISIFFTDKNGLITDWSRGAETCFGWRGVEVIGQSLTVLFTLEDVSDRIPQKKLSDSLKADGPIDERWLRRKDGTRFWGTSRFVALINPSLQGFAVVTRNTTDRRLVEQDLRIRSEVLATMNESVFVVNEDLTILFTNPTMERTFGYNPGELIGAKVTQLNRYPPEQTAAHLATLLAHLQSHHVWEGEWQNKKKDGTPFTTYTRLTLLDHHGVKYFVYVQEDISAWKEAQAALTRSKEELEIRVAERTSQLNEVVANLEAFSYSISHDIKTPLRAIAGYTEALIEDHGEAMPKAAVRYLDQIQGASRQLERLVHDVLLHSRVLRERMTLVRVDVAAIIGEVMQHNSTLQPPNAEIRIETPLLPILAHPPLLAQVFGNLLGNAVKFVAPGTKPKVTVRSEDAGLEVKIWVEDNGIGVSPAEQERIFEMFERGSSGRAYEGTGIGLSIVRKAVEKMGGTVGVLSSPGHGSKFWVCLRKG